MSSPTMDPRPVNLTRRKLVTAFAAVPALPLLACAAPQESAQASAPIQDAPIQDAPDREIPTLRATVILVRHTEKDTNDRRDPDLSEAGVARAAEFARMFSAAGVTGIIHSEYKRTRDTLAPLAKASGVVAEVIPAADHDGLIQRLSQAGPDEVIAVAGHSNTVPHIAWTFGVDLPDLDTTVLSEFGGYLPSKAYDRVHVLTPGPKSARLTELRFGEPSPVHNPETDKH